MKLTVKNRYLYEDGKPFFWLGDTAWLLFEKLNLDEIKHYLTVRAEQGFNVVQATILHTPSGVESGKTANKQYFDKIAASVEFAKSKGIYFGLLPCWGAFVKQEIVNEANYKTYANYLGERFKTYENIIWVLGGDIRGSVAPDLFNGFGQILKEHNPQRLITFHPFGRTGSYRWFNECDWLDLNMFQSGHRRYGQIMPTADDNAVAGENNYEEDNYKYIKESQSLTPVKPCLDGEPSYEAIVQGLHDFTQPRWQAKDVRRYAYWSVLSGACGFTYGHNAVMQFHRFGDEDASYGVNEEWRTALFSEGAGQMKYLKELMLSVDFTKGICRDELIINNGERYGHTALFAGENFALLYNFSGDAIRLNPPFEGACAAYEFNPTNGEKKFIANFDCKKNLEFAATNDCDRVIILKKI